MIVRRILLAAALILGLASPAAAQSLFFSFDDISASNVDFSFTLPASPRPDAVDPGDDDEEPLFFEIFNVDVTTNANGTVSVTQQDLQFLRGDDDGGLTTFVMGSDIVVSDLLGPQLFTGALDAPTFRQGSFQLRANPAGSLSGSGTLTISPVVAAAVPEPATWGTMLIGFGAVGAVMRRRRALVQVVRAV